MPNCYDCDDKNDEIAKLEKEFLYWSDVAKSLKKDLENEVMTKLKAWHKLDAIRKLKDRIKDQYPLEESEINYINEMEKILEDDKN